MVREDSYLESVFPEPPLVSYRRQKNIRETIVRAKVAPDQREQRTQKGMKKCGLLIHSGRQNSKRSKLQRKEICMEDWETGPLL